MVELGVLWRSGLGDNQEMGFGWMVFESNAGSRCEAGFELTEEDGEEGKKNTTLSPPFMGDMRAGWLAG